MASNSQNYSEDKNDVVYFGTGSQKDESKHEIIEDEERSQERQKSDEEELFVNQGECHGCTTVCVSCFLFFFEF
jgi:coenzyme F420-reducing hydrogenase gamma subunit